MVKKSSVALLISLFLLFCYSCATKPVQEDPVVETPVTVEPAVEPDPPVDVDPVRQPEEDNSGKFVVTEQVFQETFVDIEDLITQLNAIINDKNYQSWTNYLTKEYISTYSSPDKLFEISQQPILKKYSIRLRSLEDYFHYVVVPSRSEARLDDIIFIDDTHIQAIMLINGKRSILYSLEKINNVWKIGI